MTTEKTTSSCQSRPTSHNYSQLINLRIRHVIQQTFLQKHRLQPSHFTSGCQSRPNTHNSTSASNTVQHVIQPTLAETQATANPLQAAIVYAHDCHLSMPISHTRTVVRECCKGDEASQWRKPIFDPRHAHTQ